MGTRKIIVIDEELCNGCGDCITSCAEGALAIVDGKARLVKEQYCDGFGACIGDCPTGALTIVDRECADYDEAATMQHVMNIRGQEGVERMKQEHEEHHAHHAHEHHGHAHAGHGPMAGPMPGGCPGAAMRTNLRGERPATPVAGGPAQLIPSELNQWPIQIHLVMPQAPFFKNRELVVMNTCGPLASADVHWRWLKGRSVVVGCPKLDQTEGYPEKLGMILAEKSIPRVIVVRMEVPCCGGLTQIVLEAAARSRRDDLIVEEAVLSLGGELIRSQQIN